MQNAENQREAILPVLDAFAIEGTLLHLDQWTDGHINRTYLARIAQADGERRFVIQRVNSRVFPDIDGLMDNAIRVSEHATRKLKAIPGVPDDTLERGVIRFRRTRDGRPGFPDPSGDVWRLYPCIERARAHRVANTPDEAYEAARAFGQFQVLLADLPGARLIETLPGFHDTPRRFEHLDQAVRNDACGHAAAVAGELEAFETLRARAGVLIEAHTQGRIPERIVHNDAKLSNVLLDLHTEKAVCVIDLDTVMPGYSLHDFGDLVRSICNPADEAEADLSKIQVRLPYFEALVDGFLDSAGSLLTPGEIALLPEAGWVLTLEVAVRFLADHLQGDRYFRIHQPGQNRIRARAQLALAQRIEEAMPELREIVRKTKPGRDACNRSPVRLERPSAEGRKKILKKVLHSL